MKKLGKFIFGTITVASAAAGAYYLYKNYIKKDSSDDFDDFEDDFEDFDTEDDSDEDSREYVSINISTPTGNSKEADEDITAPHEEDFDPEDEL
ncbi:MAG: hypothetical protein K0S01_3463 [Herbinix sp.]|jgi:hypothetical protein|nr:hypothetical protein [Herbinix sp.]